MSPKKDFRFAVCFVAFTVIAGTSGVTGNPFSSLFNWVNQIFGTNEPTQPVQPAQPARTPGIGQHRNPFTSFSKWGKQTVDTIKPTQHGRTSGSSLCWTENLHEKWGVCFVNDDNDVLNSTSETMTQCQNLCLDAVADSEAKRCHGFRYSESTGECIMYNAKNLKELNQKYVRKQCDPSFKNIVRICGKRSIGVNFGFRG